MFAVIILLLIVGAIFGIGYRFGWNAACRLYRDRDVGRAMKRYEEDHV